MAIDQVQALTEHDLWMLQTMRRFAISYDRDLAMYVYSLDGIERGHAYCYGVAELTLWAIVREE